MEYLLSRLADNVVITVVMIAVVGEKYIIKYYWRIYY